ncbi:MAG TPA: efflux RND transporter periplasmic adaptor subunit [Thermoanaerobaculia bacterium]|nr:efflux RND transporter periplasmic adaptor subunit [Thermoanaerobaculia bacterium]
MTRSNAALLSSVLALAAAGCSKPVAGRAAPGAGRPPVAVETVKVATADLEQTVDVVGTLAARSEADVRTEYSGTVAEVYVTQWVRVKAGTPLARLDTREADAAVAAARAAALQAEVAVQRAARELERSAKLKQAGLATQQGLDEARTADEAARAGEAAAKAQLAMAETRRTKAVLRAPIDGVVATRNVNVGDFVENMGNPPPMFRIVDNRLLELTASVPSARMAELRPGQPFAFSSDAFPGREFAGRVSFINPAADEASRTVKVKTEVPNPDESLKAGLFVKGRIVTGRRSSILVVPRSALVSWDTAARSAGVFVVEGGAAKRLLVETGAASGDRVEIVKGLAAGQDVVTRGGFSLRDGDRVQTSAKA